MPAWFAALVVCLLLEMRLPVWFAALRTWARRRVYERAHAEFIERYGRPPTGPRDIFVLRTMIESRLRGGR